MTFIDIEIIIFTEGNNLSITADNTIVQLFFNGNVVPNSQLTYRTTLRLVDTVPLPDTTSVIAVTAWNNVGGSGVYGSDTNNYILTNSAWKCTTNLQTSNSWTTVTYDDSSWPKAVSYNRSYNVIGVPATLYKVNLLAEWIWTELVGNNQTIFCRLRL